MKFFQKQVIDVRVQGMWSTTWYGTKYVVLVTWVKKLFGIELIKNTNMVAAYDTKQEARKHAKRLRHKHGVPAKHQ